jgi:hypothetical protein
MVSNYDLLEVLGGFGCKAGLYASELNMEDREYL